MTIRGQGTGARVAPSLLIGPGEEAGPPWSQQLHRAELHQATGIPSVSLDVPLKDALLRLRDYSFGVATHDDTH